MLARKYELCPRVPPIHERIALQCAKNICQSAAALPKPRTRNGYLPVLVELRNTDEDVVYRYQVNLPPNSEDQDHQQMNSVEAKALSQQLNLPCLLHDRNPMHQDLTPLSDDTDAPQLVMIQDAVHVVHDLPDAHPNGAFPKQSISTFGNCAYAIGASKMTRDHFMSTLHEQQPSPMEFTVLWADQQPTEEQQQPLYPKEQTPIAQLADDKNAMKPQTPLLASNRYNFPPPNHNSGHFMHHQQQPQQPQPLLEPSGNQPLPPPQQQHKYQQLQPKFPIGYRQSRKPFRLFNSAPNNNNNNTNMMYQMKRATNNFGLSARSTSAVNPSNGYNSLQLAQATNSYDFVHGQNMQNDQTEPFAYCEQLELTRHELEQREYLRMLSGNQHQMHIRPIFGNPFEYKRDLPVRQNLEQELENQQQIEQEKYKRMLTDSLESTQGPPELHSMFQWNCCHLCHTAMSTMRNALDHYLSRMHQRRVDSWLIRYSFVKGNPSEDMLRHLRSSSPAVLHCDLCDLKLTSVMHARQHFYGRRHRLVERNISKPNGEGYYDKTGRWVRTNEKWLTCKLCDVVVTSESQLAIHTAGLRHRKRERSIYPNNFSEPYDGSHVYRINPNGSLSPLNPQGYYMNSGWGNKQQQLPQDVRKFNDVNAAFYCEVCNITLNHMKSVKQHEEGRIHKKRLERFTKAEYV